MAKLHAYLVQSVLKRCKEQALFCNGNQEVTLFYVVMIRHQKQLSQCIEKLRLEP